MKGDALANMLKDRRILVIIIAVVVIIAAVAAYVVLKDDGGNGGSSSADDLVVGDGQTREITEDMTIDGNITVENGQTLNLTVKLDRILEPGHSFTQEMITTVLIINESMNNKPVV